jgi:hypothetical protein
VPPFCKSVIIEANSPRLSVGPVYVGWFDCKYDCDNIDENWFAKDLDTSMSSDNSN